MLSVSISEEVFVSLISHLENETQRGQMVVFVCLHFC